jgi:signal transduction histidine kinase
MLDPALRRHTNLVAPAVAACRFALENSRMHADLRAQLTELQESASRIAQAELTGRRKIERDLHDGAQQTLWAARMSLGEARQKTAPGTAAYEAIRQAQSDLGAATDELRRLARGISPPILTQSGLRPALEGVIERLGVRVTGSVLSDRLEPAVENTAYFVACEAITNAVKHGASPS